MSKVLSKFGLGCFAWFAMPNPRFRQGSMGCSGKPSKRTLCWLRRNRYLELYDPWPPLAPHYNFLPTRFLHPYELTFHPMMYDSPSWTSKMSSVHKIHITQWLVQPALRQIKRQPALDHTPAGTCGSKPSVLCSKVWLMELNVRR